MHTNSIVVAPQHFRFMQRFMAAAAGLVIMLAAAVFSNQASADSGDPPARVGRVGFVEGDVSFFSDRNEGWKKARLNFPVTSRNAIWVNGNGRAEIRIGAAALRVDDNTVLDVSALDDSRTALFLQRGTLNVRTRSYAGNEDYRDNFRVETNEAVVVLNGNGRYRLVSDQVANETRIHVFAGKATVENGSARLGVDPGKSLVVRMAGGSPSFNYGSARENEFDLWAAARDLRWDDTHQRYAMERRISPYMTGYEDLDNNGDWIDDRQYGRIWAPRVVAAGWAPYRYGSWSYVRPWGWTWVDDAAWGFAPFHYGRWVTVRGRWYWWPGAFVSRPVYAPALVAWTGHGNWNVTLSVGSPVGWFPLAPREYYVPTYSSNRTYIRNINNITNNNITIINPPAHYTNQTNGTTVVSGATVVQGEPVWRQATIGGGAQSTRMVKPAVDPHAAPGMAAPPPPPAPSPSGQTAILGEPVRAPSGFQAPVPNPPRAPTAVAGEAPRAVPGSSAPGAFPRVVGEAPAPSSPTATRLQGEAPTVSATPSPPAFAKPGASASSGSAQPGEAPSGWSGRGKPNPRVAGGDVVAPAPAANVATPATPAPSFAKPGVARETVSGGVVVDGPVQRKAPRADPRSEARAGAGSMPQEVRRERQEVRREGRSEAQAERAVERGERKEHQVVTKPRAEPRAERAEKRDGEAGSSGKVGQLR